MQELGDPGFRGNWGKDRDIHTMICSKLLSKLILIVLVVLFANSTQASTTYQFVVTGGVLQTKHKPFLAEIKLSDSATQAGQATSSDIDSFRIIGGDYIPQVDPIIFSDLHDHFVDVAVTLSSDRKTIASFYARNSQSNEQYDYWVFYQPVPNAPGQNVHDNVVRISAETVRMDTLLLPNFDYTSSNITGEWQEYRGILQCWICDRFRELVLVCFPWCPWPWILLGSIFIIVVSVLYVKRNRQNRRR